jgi:hypothetical protein
MHGTNFIDSIKEWIWKTTKNQKMIFLWQITALFCLILWTLWPDILKTIIARQGNAPVKLASGFCFIVYCPEIIRRLISRYSDIEFKVDRPTIQKQAPKHWKRIDWILVDELIEFMLGEDWLPVESVKNFFWISNQAYKKLWDNLERLGILKRWPNNARILGTVDTDYILEVMESNEDSDKLFYKENPHEISYIKKF